MAGVAWAARRRPESSTEVIGTTGRWRNFGGTVQLEGCRVQDVADDEVAFQFIERRGIRRGIRHVDELLSPGSDTMPYDRAGLRPAW